MEKTCFWVPAIVQFITGFFIFFSIIQSLNLLGNIYAQIITVTLFLLSIMKLEYHLYFRR